MEIFRETERLIIRYFDDADAQGIYELDSDMNVHRYLGEKPILSMKEAKETVDYIKNQYLEDGLGRWAIIDKASNEFIGWSGLKIERMVREQAYYDLGYRLKTKFWGKGIATETSKIALKHGFETLNLPEICAGAHLDNIGSNRVLQKVGMQCLEQFDYESLPHNWYSITKDDWLKLQ